MTRKAAAWRSVALIGAGIGALSCRQIIGIPASNGSPDAGEPTSACGLAYGTTTCASCAQANCCAESDTCANDPACAAYESCFGQCKGDPSCWAQCIDGYPASGADVTALSVCMATHCETQCGLTCGAFAGKWVQADAAVTCEACITASACAQVEACATLPDCDGVNRCINSCVTEDCTTGCDDSHGQDESVAFSPDAAPDPPLVASYNTARSKCNAACNVGNDWSCVGHVSWPSPSSPSYTYYFWVKDYSTNAPVADAGVTMCTADDIDCTMPIAMRVTDANGRVEFPIQNVQNAGGQQSLGLLGYFTVSATDALPNYYYWGFPLSGTTFSSYGLTTTPSEIQGLYSSVGVTPDSSRGSLTVAVYDCQFSAAPGVEVTLSTADSMTQVFTTQGVATNVTDQAALLVFTNVPAGAVEAVASPQTLKSPASKVTAVVRAGANTTLLAFPTPL